MPIVFSPGESETRPLNPTGLVYTTAQKVADFLGIGPQDPVIVSGDSIATAVYVTGADYRDMGFEVGDSILIYSDADPLGLTRTITAIATNVLGVALSFTDTITHADYQVADNAYVQNQASFTNGAVGRQRGMTKAIVETRIQEIQDKIDNITHNAWRPYLVTAEYINFDTYKPYRRRYYTDYVGTAPLLFRNVQQILRLELWQGDDYREIAAAEARIHLPEDVRAISGSIVVSPGNGTAATLTAGTTSAQWRADFDSTTSAQNLADLINKEDRVSKTDVAFSPAFTLEGSTANIAVHNEFLATANADYGTGKVKISSLRHVKAGETCSIVTTDSNIELKQVAGKSGTVSGGVYSVSITTGGTGYTTGTFTPTGGSGTGYQASLRATAGVIDDIQSTVAAGSGYKVGDVLTVPGGGGDATLTIGIIDAVDSTTISAVDTSAFVKAGVVLVGSEVFSYTGTTATSFTGCANVVGTPLTTLATYSVSGTETMTQNVFQVDLQGGSSSGDSGRLRDWWLDHENGIIYFNNSYPFFEWNAIKCSYIYGERYLEKAIEEVAIKMVAIDILISDDRSVLIPEGTQNVDLTSKIQLLQSDVDRILSRYIEIVVFE
tara:strand:+ start:4151 stop:5974 length:1824 start_codon:yes stop_codon:yes gene_type:complete